MSLGDDITPEKATAAFRFAMETLSRVPKDDPHEFEAHLTAAPARAALVQIAPAPTAWVSVEERLPEFDVPVWMHESGGRIRIGAWCFTGDGSLWTNCYGSEFYSHKLGRWDASDMEMDDDYQPTHWMPLPEPPGNEAAQSSAPSSGGSSKGGA
jgi:hypothetical protein